MSDPASQASDSEPAPSRVSLLLAVTGVVYGDIGTSPLYTLREVFSGQYGVLASHDTILGILSLILWSLIWVVSLKYVMLILRADNEGEGGVMALTALARSAAAAHPRLASLLMLLGLFGAALFYGDSMITPAISVLSAIEGLEVAFDGISHWILPISLAVLVGLFLIQRHGTERIGALFGPIMLLWFLVLATLGVHGIQRNPQVLQALNPWWVVHFFIIHPGVGLTILGAVVLAVTGAEALYADMGHFGRKPITRAWLLLVLPALLLNYFGQGALLLEAPEAARNPFYLLTPNWARLPMIVLATLATIIASQAVISGAFSLTHQAIQLDCVPRMQIQHTSTAERGQVYIGVVNWALMTGVVLLVLGFRTSDALASAYGVAVTATMLITTLLVAAVMLLSWQVPRWLAIPMLLGFLIVDALFFAANIPKLLEGGIFPVLAGLLLFLLMTTWRRGKQVLFERLDLHALSLPVFIDSIRRLPPHRVQGTAVFLTARPDAVPHALLENLLHNQVIHQQVVLLTVLTENQPRVAKDRRFEVENYGEDFYRVLLHFGFMEQPDVPKALQLCHLDQLDFDPMRTTYFLSRETLIPSKRIGMPPWRDRLFSLLQRNATSSMRYFRLPLNRVVELGMQIEI